MEHREGNANNFIIAVDGVNLTSELLLDTEYPIKMTHVYAVDSKCCCLNKIDENSEKVYNQYLERVERFVRGTVGSLGESFTTENFSRDDFANNGSGYGVFISIVVLN